MDIFKKGDIIRCVNAFGYTDRLIVNRLYTVIKPYVSQTIIIIDERGNDMCIYSHRFIYDTEANRKRIINQILD